MKVLAIGNSFSQDATRYLQRIAKFAEFDEEITQEQIRIAKQCIHSLT